MSGRTFFISIEGDCDLTVDEVWPDGNAPENPTPEDVIKQMRLGAVDTIREWNLPVAIRVNGVAGPEDH